MTIPIYYLPRVPDAPITTEWTTFCHDKEFIVVSHDTLRKTGRSCVERKHKFGVTFYRRGKVCLVEGQQSYHLTLEHARKRAEALSKEYSASA